MMTFFFVNNHLKKNFLVTFQCLFINNKPPRNFICCIFCIHLYLSILPKYSLNQIKKRTNECFEFKQTQISLSHFHFMMINKETLDYYLSKRQRGKKLFNNQK